MMVLILPLFLFFIDNTYHKIVHKKFFSTPFTWTIFVTSILYVSDREDVDHIEMEDAKNIFNLIHDKFELKKIGYDKHKYHEAPIDYNYIFYHYEYPTICNQTVQKEAVNYFMEKYNDPVLAYLNAEQIHKKIFFNLFVHNFTKWTALSFQSLKMGLGGLSVFLVLIVSLFLLLNIYFKFGSPIFLFLSFLLMLILMNRFLVSISVHSIIRYFFYTSWIPIFLFFLGLNKMKGNVE
jgi:hypothetical protein